MSLGLPTAEGRIRQIRRETFYLKVFLIGVALVLILLALWFLKTQPKPLPISHQVKAQALALGTRSCALDMHEACLVCLHKEAQGILVSTYC